MRRSFALPLACLTLTGILSAQSDPSPSLKERPKPIAEQPADVNAAEAASPNSIVTLPTGTKVLLVLKNSLSTRNARPGDGVYLESTFPVMAHGRVLIPAGTFVQGEVSSVKRSGRVKGRAEILVHFNTLIYPNGYTVSLPGALESADSSDAQRVKDKEGTVQADGTKGKDAATIATAAGTGGLIGGLSRGTLKGAGVGGAIGGAVGAAAVLFTRGDEVKLDSGTSVEMVLERPLDLDLTRIDPNARNVSSTPQRSRKLERPASNSLPTLNPLPGTNGPLVR
jgi:hypothetical protein